MGEYPYPWLKRTGVNGGSRVNLNGTVATYAFTNYLVAPQEPSKAPSGTWSSRLAEVDYLGHGNPIYVFEGIIPSGVKTDADGSVIITLPLLGSFAKLGSPVYFDDPEFIFNPAGSACVFIKSFKVQKPDAEQLRRYTMEFWETKEW
jgi:hypothetical protein